MSEAVAVSSSASDRSPAIAGLEQSPQSPILAAARERGQRDNLPYAGSVTPQEAWELLTETSPEQLPALDAALAYWQQK